MSIGETKVEESGRQALQTLRIIVLALAAGVTAFALFAVYQNWGKPHTVGQKLDAQAMVFLAMGLTALPLGLVMPRLMGGSTTAAPTSFHSPAGASQESARHVVAAQQRIQTRIIIACAIFEGAAFANVFGYMQSREVLHLALAGMLVAAILVHFPVSGGAFQEAVERELRQ